MTDTTPEWSKRFDEKFTYLDEGEDRYWLAGFNGDKNKNYDLCDEVKDFITQELKTNSLQLLEEIEREVEGLKQTIDEQFKKILDGKRDSNDGNIRNATLEEVLRKISQIITRIKES